MLQYKLKHYFFKNSNLIDDVFKTLLEHNVKNARKNTMLSIATWDKWVCTYFMKMTWG